MKKQLTFLSILFISVFAVQAQESNTYITTYMDIPLTWASVEDNGTSLDAPVRFAPFFSFGNSLNYDFAESAGIYLGWNITNTGFIYDVDEFTRKKVRNYYVGFPVGLKFGNADKGYISAGYEIAVPLHYKEKTFINEQKDKFGTWFSDRTVFQQAFTVGLQSPYGAGLKFKYYFTNFYDQSYTASDGQGGSVRPYENLNANMFSISLTFEILRGKDFVYNE